MSEYQVGDIVEFSFTYRGYLLTGTAKISIVYDEVDGYDYLAEVKTRTDNVGGGYYGPGRPILLREYEMIRPRIAPDLTQFLEACDVRN